MKKGHYGHYTGNARHSRKEEMIHDREMIYDAKTQIHNEDEKYKHTGESGYKQDMIHERELIHDTKTQLHHADSDYKGDSPAHLSYSSRFGGMTLTDPVSTGAYANFDGGAAGDVSAMRQKAKGISNLQKSISDTVGNYYDKKPAGKKEDNKTQTYKTRGMKINTISLTKSNIPDVDTSFVDSSIKTSVKTPKNIVLEHIQTNKGYQGEKMSDAAWKALSPEKRRSMNAAVGADKSGNIQKNTYTMNGKNITKEEYEPFTFKG